MRTRFSYYITRSLWDQNSGSVGLTAVRSRTLFSSRPPDQAIVWLGGFYGSIRKRRQRAEAVGQATNVVENSIKPFTTDLAAYRRGAKRWAFVDARPAPASEATAEKQTWSQMMTRNMTSVVAGASQGYAFVVSKLRRDDCHKPNALLAGYVVGLSTARHSRDRGVP